MSSQFGSSGGSSNGGGSGGFPNAPAPSFSFGTGANSAGFSFGHNNTAANTTTSGAGGGGSFNFGAASAASTTTGGFTFGSTNSTASSSSAPTSTNFGFGATASDKGSSSATATTGTTGSTFSFGGSGNSTGAVGSSFSFGSAKAPPSSSSSASAGPSEPQDNNNKVPKVSFGTTTTDKPGGFGSAGEGFSSSSFSGNPTAANIGTTKSDANTLGGFAFGGASSSASSFSFGGGIANSATAKSNAAPSAFSFGSSTAVPAATGNPTLSDKPSAGASFSAPTTANSAKSNAAPGGFSFGSTTTTAPAAGNDTSSAKTNAVPGGFSFGGATAAPATGTAPSSAKPDAAPAGFSLAAAADTTDKGASASGFTFGSGNSNKSQEDSKPPAAANNYDSFSSVPPTPGTPAPVATPKAASNVTQPPQPVRLEYQTLTVEQIINKFQKELERDALLYNEEARRVAEYDAILRDSHRDIATLTEQTHRAMLQQQEVEKTILGIAALQDELDRTVESLEGHLDALFAATKNMPPVEADRQREHTYSTAKAVDMRLQAINDSLEAVMGELNAAQERSLPKEGDLAAIFKMLNQHQDMLSELKTSSQRMEKDIENATRMLTQA